MNIGRIQRTLTAEPVVDPVPGTERDRPTEAVPATVATTTPSYPAADDGHATVPVAAETVG
jgi:hypothetical protein